MKIRRISTRMNKPENDDASIPQPVELPHDRQRSTGRRRQSVGGTGMVTEEGCYQTRERHRECKRSRELLRVAGRVQPAFIVADLPCARQAWGERPGV